MLSTEQTFALKLSFTTTYCRAVTYSRKNQIPELAPTNYLLSDQVLLLWQPPWPDDGNRIYLLAIKDCVSVEQQKRPPLASLCSEQVNKMGDSDPNSYLDSFANWDRQ